MIELLLCPRYACHAAYCRRFSMLPLSPLFFAALFASDDAARDMIRDTLLTAAAAARHACHAAPLRRCLLLLFAMTTFYDIITLPL